MTACTIWRLSHFPKDRDRGIQPLIVTASGASGPLLTKGQRRNAQGVRLVQLNPSPGFSLDHGLSTMVRMWRLSYRASGEIPT